MLLHSKMVMGESYNDCTTQPINICEQSRPWTTLHGRLLRLCWRVNWIRPPCSIGRSTAKVRRKCQTSSNYWNFWFDVHELLRTTKKSLSRSILPTHRRRTQLDHLTWPILARRVYRARRPIICSTPASRSKRYCTNEKWLWSRIADCA